MDFTNFMRYILSTYGNLKPTYVDIFTSPESMRRFEIAFTHKSFDSINNYEVYELWGDGVVNEFVPFYIRWRFPDIKNVNWFSKLKANLMGKRTLAQIASKHGFDKYIRYKSPGRALGIGHIDRNSKDYLSLLEDVVEAFMGCLVEVIEMGSYIKNGKKIKFTHGTAIMVCRNILRSFFNSIAISTDYRDVFDSVTRLKQLYELKGKFKWPITEGETYVFEYPKDNKGVFTVSVYGWPKGDKMYKPENRVFLAKESSKIKDEAQQKAADMALKVLATTYHIYEVPIDRTQGPNFR